MKANFFSRLGALIIDFIIISLLATMITGYLPMSEKQEKLIDDRIKIAEDYADQKISYEEYFEEFNNLNYEISKNNILNNSISIIITLSYFVLLLYFNKGRTVGKVITKCRLVSKDEKLSLLTVIIRSILVTANISAIIGVVMISFVDKEIYLKVLLLAELIEGLFLIICGVMILYRKDKRGLQDLLLNTEVIREEVIE